MLYAQIVDGKAINIQPAGDVEAYRALYPQFDTAEWVIKEVPDGTLAGATDNGDGTFTNPPAPEPVPDPEPSPTALTKAQFLTLFTANGGDLTATLAAWV